MVESVLIATGASFGLYTRGQNRKRIHGDPESTCALDETGVSLRWPQAVMIVTLRMAKPISNSESDTESRFSPIAVSANSTIAAPSLMGPRSEAGIFAPVHGSIL
jgi:hypothetical protein